MHICLSFPPSLLPCLTASISHYLLPLIHPAAHACTIHELVGQKFEEQSEVNESPPAAHLTRPTLQRRREGRVRKEAAGVAGRE